ncbi:MAG: hypothetical protein F4X51_22560 [Gemmatimonadetes bacterium]|nr:hypothetical protein [Gemmatimonadota bacterium]
MDGWHRRCAFNARVGNCAVSIESFIFCSIALVPAFIRIHLPVSGAPDLAVEVISPNDRAVEVEDRASDWLRAGAKMVIVLNPKTRTATIYRGFDDIRMLTEGDKIDGGDVVPGWQLPLADVF